LKYGSSIVQKGNCSRNITAPKQTIFVRDLAARALCRYYVFFFHSLSACAFGILPVAGFRRRFSPRNRRTPPTNRPAGTAECAACELGARSPAVVLDAFHPAQCGLVGNTGTARRYGSRGGSSEYAQGLWYRSGSAI